MALVHEYVWYVLAGALVVGFILAWIMRGLRKSPAAQRAIVDRDIALLELQQTKDELDSLFAAQRKWKAESKAAAAEGADPALKAEVERLKAELAAAKASAEFAPATPAAQPEAVHQGETAAAPLPAAPKAPAPEEVAMRKALIARNEYLEERVHDVELRLHEMAKSYATAKAQEADAVTSEGGKAAWIASYLAVRAEALQARLLALEASPKAPALPDNTAAPDDDHDKDEEANTTERDEEIARLRWRNRYLESRLAYLGQPAARIDKDNRPPAQSAAQPARPSVNTSQTATTAPRPATPPGETRLKPAETGPDRTAARGPRFSSPLSALASAAQERQASEPARPSVVTPEEGAPSKPPAQEAANGQADDLTRISGLSSSIELKLNEIGIWHYVQIARWSQGNLEWVDQEFGLDGQAKREGWISQARQLVE
ncbi:hypothetical protein [Henriciella marina]|uniref:hypothetical protein n=1 Tax=Henriciella marina TaxID=453851 RepID=UPI00035DE66F|nr:hypothetical protein [Henriciella marina]